MDFACANFKALGQRPPVRLGFKSLEPFPTEGGPPIATELPTVKRFSCVVDSFLWIDYDLYPEFSPPGKPPQMKREHSETKHLNEDNPPATQATASDSDDIKGTKPYAQLIY